jgi:DNA repair exonuclease SbcCD ATPase subunit
MDELVNYKDKISNDLTETSQKLENLNQNQEKLVEQQNELTQRIKDIEVKINNLGSLREDLQKAEMAISKASPDWNIKALTNLIEKLKKTHAELGARQKEENELADLEERLEYLKTGDRSLKQCENHLGSITQELGPLLKHPNQELIGTGSSESSESSHCSLKEFFDQNEKITGIEENLGEIKKFCQQMDQDLTARSNQLLEEVYQELTQLKNQMADAKVISYFYQENFHSNGLNIDDRNNLKKRFR